MKILIFGKNGQVGSSLMRLLCAKHEVIGFDQAELDLVETAQIAQAIHSISPDWIINTSAYTAVDRAESEPELADAVNHLAAAAMAKACADLTKSGKACGLLHYSTDYVFDGAAKQPYLEDDQPKPQSVYGHTKLAGEVAVMQQFPDSIILRTAWVYALEGSNFVNTMLRLAAGRDEVGVVADQFGSPTLAEDLARASIEIIEQTALDSLAKVAGIYHATGGGETSWHGFAAEIFSLSGKQVRVKAIASEAYPTPAPRPKYSVLNNQKLKNTFSVQLPHWKASLEKMLSSKQA